MKKKNIETKPARKMTLTDVTEGVKEVAGAFAAVLGVVATVISLTKKD